MALFDNIMDGAPNNQSDPPNYNYFGKYADVAKKEGFFPESDPDKSTGAITFRSPYHGAFNDVVIPNEKEKGHIAIIGYPNQKFDVVIRDKDGNIKKKMMDKISSEEVQKYITNSSSTVAQRTDRAIDNAKKNNDMAYLPLN